MTEAEARKAVGAEQTLYTLPAGATEVILVRHCASEAAIPGQRFSLVDGHSDPNLSELGRAQAELVAAPLADEPVARVFVSPLRRTHQTIAPYVRASGHEPTIVHELREVHFGEWEGGEYRVRAWRGDPLVKRIHEEERWDLIPGAESLEVFGARVRAGIERVVEETGPDRGRRRRRPRRGDRRAVPAGTMPAK